MRKTARGTRASDADPSGAPGGAGAPGAPGGARIRLSGSAGGGSDLAVVALYAVTLLLVGIGLVMVLSSSSITSYLADQGFFGGFWKQATYAVVGLPLMLLAAAMPVRFWKRWAWWLFALGLGLQALVFSPLGIDIYGNRNWISLGGGLTAQPSEALKLALIVWIGTVLAAKEKLLGQVKHELIPVVLPGAAIALGLVVLGHDLGTAMVMGLAVIGTMFFGGLSWKSIGVVVGAAVLGVVALVITSPNRLARIFATGEDYSGLDWQPLHGLWALSGGGVFGVGLGGSKAKWSWLPAAEDDYIFAIIGEELGFVGALLIIGLFVVLAAVMLRVVARARDRFGRAVVGGILVWIIGQAFVNIGVVIGILPSLGVPLPLISAGGTALIACMLAMGVVISVARDSAQYQAELAAAGERIA